MHITVVKLQILLKITATLLNLIYWFFGKVLLFLDDLSNTNNGLNLVPTQDF
jgi:hypothetical protein